MSGLIAFGQVMSEPGSILSTLVVGKDNLLQFYKPPALNPKKRKLRHSLSEAVAVFGKSIINTSSPACAKTIVT